ncbi:MAG TPA: ABC transporter permease [Solirubrobacteraceae bacterium]
MSRPAAPPPPQAFAQLVACEARLAWRNPRGLVVGIAFPVVMLVVFGELPHAQLHRLALGGLTRFDVEVPVLATLVIAALALVSLPGPLATYRQEGTLRRLATTPAPRSWVLAAPVVINLGLALVGLIVVFLLGHVAFGLVIPRNPGALALTLVLCISALFAIGLAIAAVAHVSGLQVISAAAFLPLVFFAGLWIPRQQMSSVLQHISDYTPLGAAVQACQNAILGAFPPARPLLVMGAYALIFGAAAWRLFRWE